MNLEKEDWWHHVFASVRDKVEMSLFVTRYICTLLIFVLGLKAPGIAANREDDYIHLENEMNTVSGMNSLGSKRLKHLNTKLVEFCIIGFKISHAELK